MSVPVGDAQFGLDPLRGFAARVDTVTAMCELGYADRMVLSHDTSCYSHNFDPEFRARELPNWRYTHISEDVIPALRQRGLTEAQLATMLIDNPRRILAGKQ